MSRTVRRRVRVAIIGAGMGGIAAAVKLQQRTSAAFTIFEQDESAGGTWWANRYPGCEVDAHSHAYSFSFVKYDWPRTHATQPELLAYVNHVLDKFRLRPHIRLNTRVTQVRWREASCSYLLETADGDAQEFDVVISAVGLLSVPRYPNWPGTDRYDGIMFHTSRWEHDHDLADKVVAVVGTGSTAAQVVPALAPVVKHLLVFQREPGWIEPKNEREFTPLERLVFRRVPLVQRANRAWLFYLAMRRFKGYDVAAKRQREMRSYCEDYINRTVTDPTTRGDVTPRYPWGCKRPIVASTFYPALNRANVTLIPTPVDSMSPTGLVDTDGAHHDVDVVVLSTGFQPTKFLASFDVIGRDERSIHDVWGDRPAATFGITVSGFPNFFILYGPNTNGGLSIIAQLERQAEVAVRGVSRLERRDAAAIDTNPAWQNRFVAWVDHQVRTHASAMESGCHNYYHSASGSNVTQWPRTHLAYLIGTRVFSRIGLRTIRTTTDMIVRQTATADAD